MRKKILKVSTLTLALILLFSLVACTKKDEQGTTPTDTAAPTDASEPTETDPTESEPTAAPEPTETEPIESTATEPEATEPKVTESEEPEETEPEETWGERLPPAFVEYPNNSTEPEDIPIAAADDLVATLDAVCQDIGIEGTTTGLLHNAAEFSNYFGGHLKYQEGLRVAVNRVEDGSVAHVAILLEVPEEDDFDTWALVMMDYANMNWSGSPAETVKCYPINGKILLAMSTSEAVEKIMDHYGAIVEN